MKKPPVRTASRSHELDFIGDHPAIDLVNTVRMVDGELTDTLQTDGDVVVWLGLASVPVSPALASWPEGSLLDATRRLRAETLKMIEAKKAGKRPPLQGLNAFLEAAVSHGRVESRTGTTVEFRRVYHARTPEEYLAPIAEAAADLLANGDFDLVRHCASERCVLRFYDRTKAHCRRYCTAAGCGNRAKVTAYRERKRSGK
ncbi:MAG: hypothetical protein JWO38_5099 [Gemmataceae bacterium]|nr:hypothetical protein [Gemmataceae bacterium]